MNWNGFIMGMCLMSIFFNVKFFSDETEDTFVFIYNIIIFLIVVIISGINSIL